jgi:hypothetical protein
MSSRFDVVVIFLIFLSAIKLVYDTYILHEDEDSGYVQASNILDIFFTVAFTLEFLVKSISVGFVTKRVPTSARLGTNSTSSLLSSAGWRFSSWGWMSPLSRSYECFEPCDPYVLSPTTSV